MTAPLDPRIHAYRDDLAASRLSGQVSAERFVDGSLYQVTAPTAPVHAKPDARSTRTSELLFGETVTVYEVREGWSWCQGTLDDYVGYVRADQLSADVVPPTHVVASLSTHLYPEPSLKVPPIDWLPFGARLSLDGEQDGYSRAPVGDGTGWVYSRHLASLNDPDPDYVATAERFLGVPYLWGGRSSAGLDCSGLVQVALERAGIDCPRDSDMMAASLGAPIDIPNDLATLPRGDLVFIPGHVVFAYGDGRCLHANAHDMAVVLEPIANLFARLTPDQGRITAIRRLNTP